jgi:hypothetical protein
MSTTPITVSLPHQLGRAEARRRIEHGFADMVRQFPGGGGAVTQRWDGDRLAFTIAVLGQTLGGSVTVLDDRVDMQIDLPGMLGMIAGRLRGGMQKAGQLLLTRK